MASIDIGATSWRRVEVGRVLKLENGGLATIVEIIDHKRVRGTRPTSPPDSEGLRNLCVRTG
jgi:large subunit ribosomal protein L14e